MLDPETFAVIFQTLVKHQDLKKKNRRKKVNRVKKNQNSKSVASEPQPGFSTSHADFLKPLISAPTTK
jgi:hypothetical protein